MLTYLEDADLKNLLVQLEERAQDKAEKAQEDAHSRLIELIRHFHHEAKKPEMQARLAALQKGELDHNEEVEHLNRLFDIERNRQGISAPTDG